MDGHLSRAAEEVKRQNVEVLECCYVMKCHDHRGEAKRILVLSDAFICYFKDLLVPVQDRTFYWTDLTSLTYRNNRLDLEFRSHPFRFTSRLSEVIFDKIVALLRCSMTSPELEAIAFSPAIQSTPRLNGWGIISRFRMEALNAGVKFEQSDIAIIQKNISQQSPIIDLTALSNTDLLPAFLTASACSPWIECIKLPKVFQADKVVAFLTSPQCHLTHIIVSGGLSSDLHHLLNGIEQSSTLYGISFEGFELTKEMLADIRESILKKELYTLGFNNSLPTRLTSSFVQNFLQPGVTDRLMMLNLNYIKGIDIPSLLKQIPNVASLSLEGCGLELGEFFNALARSQMSRICLLNLSKNFCVNQIDRSLQRPTTLQTLYINGCSFRNKALRSLFRFILGSQWPSGLALHADGIEVVFGEAFDENDFDSVIDGFDKSPVHEFSWNSNQLSNGLVRYLERSRHLRVLYLADLIKLCDYGLIGSALSNMKHLRQLVLSNTYLGANFIPILHSIESLPSLHYLDVRNSLMGDEGIECLGSLIRIIPCLVSLFFDGSHFKNFSSLEGLVIACEQRKTEIFLAFPDSDVSKINAEVNISNLRWRCQALNNPELKNTDFVSGSLSHSCTRAPLIPNQLRCQPQYSLVLPLETKGSLLNGQFPIYVSESLQMMLNGIAEVVESSSSSYSENMTDSDNEDSSFGTEDLEPIGKIRVERELLPSAEALFSNL